MATTLTVAAVDQTAKVQWGSMTCKLNTLDFTLVDPATRPLIGDAVALAGPAWSGAVTSVETADPVDRATGHVLVKVTATNTTAAAASAAPFGLSDAPDNVTTYGYRSLRVQTAANQDGTTTIHGSCTIQQAGLWPAMTFLLISGNQGMASPGYGFSVTNTTATWPTPAVPQYQIEFGDPIVTMDVWVASQSANVPDGSISGTKITAGSVDTPQLAANSVKAAQIQAGSVTADKLAATLILASLIKTATAGGGDPGTGLRVEMDRLGVRAYDASNNLQVNIPTDGSAVYVRGQISATNLVATNSSSFSGTTTINSASNLTVAGAVVDPNAAPVLVGYVPGLALQSQPAHPSGAGVCVETSGYGGVPTFWIGATADDGGTTDIAYEYRLSDGALLRTLRKTGSTTTVTGAILGATSHVSDTAEAATGSGYNSQVATPLTFPNYQGIQVTAVSVYMAGYGGSTTCRNAVWNTSGTMLRYSSEYTAASAAFNNGNSVHHNMSLTSPLSVAAGATIWAGWAHSGSGGHQWDRDDGTGHTTKLGQNSSDTGNFGATIGTETTEKPNVYVTYNYTVDSSLEGTMGTIVGIARVGTYIWVLDDLGTLFQYNQGDLSYVGKTTAIAGYIVNKPSAGLFWDGTYIIACSVTGTTGSDQARLVKCSTSGAYVSTSDLSGFAFNGATSAVRGGALAYDPLSGLNAYWLSIGGTVYAYRADTGASLPYRDFGGPNETGGGVGWDGTCFRGWSAANLGYVWQYSSWDWNVATTYVWASYSWYDDAGTVHETRVGPRASCPLGRRRYLQATAPNIPTGGADDPDKVRWYLYGGASDPGYGGSWLQATTAATQATFSSYTGSGTHDPTSNNFPGGSPGLIQSAASGWKLWGDGTMSTGDLSIGRLLGSVEFYDPSNPFIDFKTNPADDYDARVIYNLGGDGRLRLYALNGIQLASQPYSASGSPLPYAIQTGTVSVTVSASSTGGPVAVAFTSGRFTQAPVVFVNNLYSGSGFNVWKGSAIGVTSTGFNAYVASMNGATASTTMTLQWVAIQQLGSGNG